MFRRPGLAVTPRFLWECLISPTVSPSPTPATSNGAGGFPALRSPARFSLLAKAYVTCRSGSAFGGGIQPLPTPPSLLDAVFLLAYSLRLRSCRSVGAFITAPLPPVLPEELQAAGPLCSTGVTPLRRYYGPIRHPLAVSPLPGAAGYRAYPASAVSGRDEEGFSSCSLCPGRRAVANHPAGVTRPVNRFATDHAAFALTVAGSASGTALSGPPRVHFRYGPATRTHPGDGVVNGLQVIWFPSCLPSSYGASDCYPDGTDSRWTQQPFLDAQPDRRISHPALRRDSETPAHDRARRRSLRRGHRPFRSRRIVAWR